MSRSGACTCRVSESGSEEAPNSSSPFKLTNKWRTLRSHIKLQKKKHFDVKKKIREIDFTKFKIKIREMVSSSESATVAMATSEAANNYHGFNHYYALITKRPAKTAYGASKRKMSMPVKQCVRITSSSNASIAITQ